MLPIDWNEWWYEWSAWREAHKDDLVATRKRFPGVNFLADERLGTWDVNGRTVELSEVTFPNLSERDSTGRLIERRNRFIGITTANGGSVVESFEELERALGLAGN